MGVVDAIYGGRYTEFMPFGIVPRQHDQGRKHMLG